MQTLRKHITLSLTVALLVLLVMASCSSEDLMGNQSNKAPDSSRTPGYLTLRVLFDKDPDTNRAPEAGDDETDNHEDKTGDFIDGMEDEYKPTDSRFLLFNGDEKLLDVISLGLTRDLEEHDGYIEARYKTKIFPLEGRDDGVTWPSYCLLVLNANSEVLKKLDGLKGTNITIDKALEIYDAAEPMGIGFSEAGNFTLTNSVYWDNVKDKDGNVSYQKITAAYIDTTKISDNPDDPNNVMTIHVERMVAKCSFEFKRDKNKLKPGEDNYIYKPNGDEPAVWMFKGLNGDQAVVYQPRKWRIKLTGWGINALERQSTIFKSISNGGWNDPDHYRTYWSQDFNYYRDNYPWQYRWAVDAPELNDKYYEKYYEKGIYGAYDGNILKNYSYDGLYLGNPTFDNHKYIPENTYDAASVKDKLDGRDELLAGSHLILGANLELEPDDDDADKDQYTDGYRTYDLYRDRGGIHYKSERDCFVALVHAFNQLLMSQSVMELVPYDWKNGGRKDHDNNGTTIQVGDTLVAKTDGKYMLCYNPKGNDNLEEFVILDDDFLSKLLKWDIEEFVSYFGGHLAPATLRHGDGKRLPWINGSIDDTARKLRIFLVEEDKNGKLVIDEDSPRLKIYTKGINDAGATYAKEYLWESNEDDIKSLLYEWLGAIDHFSDGKMYYAHGINNPFADDEKEKHYGVVRNNWYQFRLKNINAVGTPVDDPTQPIVPETVNNNDQINVTIEILKWHEVESDVPIF